METDPDLPGAHCYAFTSADGLSIFFRTWGERSRDRLPLVCLHGFTRNGRDFAELAARHAARRLVIAPDYRGRGRSAWAERPERYDPLKLLDDIRHLLIVCRIERAIFCGTSLGGLLSLGMTLIQPGVVAAVILNDIGPRTEPAGIAATLAAYRGVPLPANWAAAPAAARRMFPQLGDRPEDFWEKVARNTFQNGEAGLVNAFDPKILGLLPSEPPEVWHLFRALGNRPALALRGAESIMLSPETFAAMGKAKPNLVQLEVPGVGHTPTLSEPSAEAAIDDFLDRVDRDHPT